jgi:hypothetical protein
MLPRVEDWVDDAATQLDRLTGSSMAGAVPGRVRIVSITEPRGRLRYQEAHLEVSAEVPGRAPELRRTEVVLDRRYWPSAGMVLPADIAPSGALEIRWDVLAR